MNAEASLQCIKAKLEMFLPPASTSQLRAAVIGIGLIDATGRKHEVPMGFAKSYEVWVQVELAALECTSVSPTK
jgi:hypothetical protein